MEITIVYLLEEVTVPKGKVPLAAMHTVDFVNFIFWTLLNAGRRRLGCIHGAEMHLGGKDDSLEDWERQLLKAYSLL